MEKKKLEELLETYESVQDFIKFLETQINNNKEKEDKGE